MIRHIVYLVRVLSIPLLLGLALSACATPTYTTPAGLTPASGATLLGSKQATSLMVADVRTIVSGVDGQTTGFGIHDWDKPLLVASGQRTIQMYLRQAQVSGSIAIPVTLEAGKTYVVQGFKYGLTS